MMTYRLRMIGAAVLLMAAGLGLGWLLFGRAPGEGGPEVRFARDMAAHHDQAVEMALAISQRTADADLRQLTTDMLLTQQAQIGQMQGWLAVWGRPLAGAEPPMAGMGEMMGMANQAQVNALREQPLAEAEVQFLQLMIRHHQGGIFMARDALADTRQPQVTRLAQAIIDGQQSEVDYMTELLAQRGAVPLAPLEPMQHSAP
jgi:uncharacterized protein (DUF305 family)